MDVFALMRDAQSGCSRLSASCSATQEQLDGLASSTALLLASKADLSATIQAVPVGLATTDGEIAALAMHHSIAAAGVARLGATATSLVLKCASLADADARARASALAALDGFCSGAATAPGRRRDDQAAQLDGLRAEFLKQTAAQLALRTVLQAKVSAANAASLAASDEDAAAARSDAGIRGLKEASPALLAALVSAKKATAVVEGDAVAAEAEAAAALASLDAGRKRLLLALARRDALRRRVKAVGLHPVA